VVSHDVHPNMTTWCSDWRSQLDYVAVQKVMSLNQNIVLIFMLFELTDSRQYVWVSISSVHCILDYLDQRNML
jgi:hypothetical protein